VPEARHPVGSFRAVIRIAEQMKQIYKIEERQAHLQQMVEDLLQEARQQGASAAEAGVSSDVGLAVNVRMGEVETIEHTRDQGLGVTVYFGQRKGTASTTDFSPQAVRDTVRAACNIARYTTDDKFSGLADPELMATDLPDLDLYHPWDIDVEIQEEPVEERVEPELSGEPEELEFAEDEPPVEVTQTRPAPRDDEYELAPIDEDELAEQRQPISTRYALLDQPEEDEEDFDDQWLERYDSFDDAEAA